MSKRLAMKVLDHGYLKLVESWGSDQSVIEAARMSTDKGFLGWGPKGVRCPRTGCGWEGASREELTREGAFVGMPTCPKCRIETDIRDIPGDEKLLKYLWDNAHATPFEMAGVTLEVQAPIMVFREWHRHRVPFGYNEMSARYTPLPDLNYLPTVERCLVVNTKNKQAGAVAGAEELTHESVIAWLEELDAVYAHSERVYQSGLKRGIPKELARLAVPVARYSRMRATGNLRGWLAFLTLRQAPNAQYEIRVYADAIHDLLVEAFPRTMELFDAGR
jgi:thymidylate synthase (FAD)